ncbi:hypothetical protein G6F57_021170 [Rhizopus arrhizus]|nr:hypothetical protein G6F57_021170 [Rhizopus arrhizus]
MLDVAELHLAAHRFGEFLRAGVVLGRLVDQREHAFRRHQHLLHAGGDVGQALDRVENLRQRGHEGSEAADGEGSAVGLTERDGDDRADRNGDADLRQRRQGRVRRSGAHGEAAKAAADEIKTAAFDFVTVEQLDDALAVDAFADHAGQLGVHVDGVAVDAAPGVDGAARDQHRSRQQE